MWLMFMLNAVCVFVLGVVLPFWDPTNTNTINSRLLKTGFDYILQHKFWAAVICGVYVFVYSFIPELMAQWSKRKVRAAILGQIAEVLGGDSHTHRITLFREISHPHAVIRACFMQLWNMASSTPKENFLVLLPSKSGAQVSSSFFFPPIGKYLIIDKRRGLPFEKSFVMFQVEKDIRERCNSILTYVRCLKETCVIQNLPDISKMHLEHYKSIDEVPIKYRADVQTYLKLGRSNDFAVLQKYTRKARHFFGTIIKQSDGNEPWGVLLIDSTGGGTPFPVPIREQLESFAKTLSVVAD